MPRVARLDVPGLLQHVIVRGVEKREIFADDPDRRRFLDRLSGLLEETETGCYAWALIPNHFHLLLLPRRLELAILMRRLLTGYAVTFNLIHQRVGHLFQNRYKSIVCDKENYLLELVRYIHLNPIRSGLVKTIEELDRYPWSGHSVLMGFCSLEGPLTLRNKGFFERGRIFVSLTRLIERVCLILGEDPEIICHPSKIRSHAEARGIISYIAVREFEYRGNEVGKELHLGAGGVSVALRRGSLILRERPEIQEEILENLVK